MTARPPRKNPGVVHAPSPSGPPLPEWPVAATISQLIAPVTLGTGAIREAGVLSSQKTHPTPKVLTLGNLNRYIEASVIPSDEIAAPAIKLWGGLQAEYTGHDTLGEVLAALVTYRVGGAQVRFAMDWLPGSYQLPACEKVDVAACGYLATARRAVVAVTDGEFQQARVPTLTGALNMTAAVAQAVAAPSCARAIEMWGAASSNIIATPSAGTFSPYIRRDTTALVYLPPWSPVDFDDRRSGDTAYSVVSDVDQKVCVRFYLAV